jgi:hypothetical protein
MSQNIHSYRLVVTKCRRIASRSGGLKSAATWSAAESTALTTDPNSSDA